MNIGTPDEPTVPAVKRYLNEFLLDPDVIDLPAPVRYLIVKGVVLNIRPQKLAPAYAGIWLPEGAPLRVYMDRIAEALRISLNGTLCEVGMRYGNPSIRAGLERLREQGVTELLLAPLFPHFAQATTVSALKQTYRQLEDMGWSPRIRELGEFPSAPDFIDPLVTSIRPLLGPNDHLLFSYHGIPVSQNRPKDATDQHWRKDRCCAVPKEASKMSEEAMGMLQDMHHGSYEQMATSNPGRALRILQEMQHSTQVSYAHQCTMTTLAVVTRLGLTEDRWSMSFQSRFGPAEWLTPATTSKVEELAARGVERLVIASPAFVADGLETLEELETEVREEFIKAGGKHVVVVPCLNANKDWIEGLGRMVAHAFEQ
jgi:ferrochelatase